MISSENFCPYLGLQPYTEAEQNYFFGRDRDVRVISSNLFASPLTVLYGPSGVGKSSVLLAGVVPFLRDIPKTAVIVFREWQNPSFLNTLKLECHKAVERAINKIVKIDQDLPFDDLLCSAAQAIEGPIFIIFDQLVFFIRPL